MSSQPQTTFLTVQDYLEIERRSESKSEYFRGEMFAMAGASRKHNLISLNISAELRALLKERPCETFVNDMRVKINRTGLYTYPDIVVVCGELDFEDDQSDTLLNPELIVEVLSKTTEAYNRGKKFEHYRKIASFKQYLLVSQDRCHVERYTRHSDSEWTLWETNDMNDTVELNAIDCQLKLSDVYTRIEFEDVDDESASLPGH